MAVEFRKANLYDEPILKGWLQNKMDCLYTIGDEQYATTMYKNWLEAHDQIGYCLTLNNHVVAYGEIWIDQEEEDLELAHLIVDPEQRNKGVGKQLIKLLLNECKDYPYEWIYMRIVPENIRAITCYERIGFTEDPHLRTSFNSKWVWMKIRNNVDESFYTYKRRT